MSHAIGNDEEVEVHLFAGLETRTRERASHVVLPATAVPTVSALLERLGLPPAAAGLRLVNGLHAGPHAALKPGDKVSLFPPLGGG